MIVLDGSELGPEQVVAVARGGEAVELAQSARERMERARAVADRVLEDAAPVYGLSTGVGVRKRAQVAVAEQTAFNRRLILNHLVGQGVAAPEDGCCPESHEMQRPASSLETKEAKTERKSEP